MHAPTTHTTCLSLVASQRHQHRQAAGAVQRCDSSDMEILAQLFSACLTVTAWDSDSSPYCVPVPVLLVSVGTISTSTTRSSTTSSSTSS
jgi:hypothetical protein